MQNISLLLLCNYSIIQMKNTPLHLAAMGDHTESVALLVSSGADVYKKGEVSICIIHFQKIRKTLLLQTTTNYKGDQ